MKIVAHGDADGVTSAVLFTKYLVSLYAKAGETIEVSFPEEFGEDEEANVMLDMKPKNPEWGGLNKIVVDHHPNHTGTYQLIWKPYPTSLIIYELARNSLKASQPDYRVAVGLVGDGQPELIPLEVWEAYPELMDDFGGVSTSYGEAKTWTRPIYSMLSSGINALCRMKREKEAFELLSKIETPIELLLNETINEAKEKVRAERDRILRSAQILRFRHSTLVVYSSAFRMEGQIASELEAEGKGLVVALNTATRKLSIRGAYAEVIARKITEAGMEADGHAGFMGGSLKDKSLNDLIRALGGT